MNAASLALMLSATLLLVSSAGWGALALWYRLPRRRGLRPVLLSAWIGLASAVALLAWHGSMATAALGWLAAFGALLAWWRTLRPSNARVWADDVARQLIVERDGSRITLHNVRAFEWRTLDDYDVHWQTRRYDLRRLQSVDAILSYWTGPAIAHTLVSFGFAGASAAAAEYLTFSLEIRKERGERYSSLGGFFKQFEINLVAADERDIVRVRSNVRGEDVYLYRVMLPPPQLRSLFIAYLDEADALRRRPRWYNTATANCTTIVFRMMRHIVKGLPFDYRLLLSGYLPGYLHEVGGLAPGVALDTLRRAGRITGRARAADDDPAFSQRIRDGVPGILQTSPVVPIPDPP